MAWVYMLRGTTGRYYVGSTSNLEQRLRQHQGGQVHSTVRLGLPLEIVATRQLPSIEQAHAAERQLKSWRKPERALAWIRKSTGE